MDQIWALGRTRREPSRPGPFPFAFPVGRGPVTAPSEFERALGALYGLAIGDALGMPTQLLSPQELDRRFGAITWFQPAPDNHPIAAGLPAGHITDDTEQALLIARLLVDGRGRIDPLTLANALADWERDMVRRGSLDLLGPSTQRAISAVAAGISVEEAGRFGDTNGAAMRVTPVGIARPVAAFALLRAARDGGAWRGCLLAASLGGDSDTIAAITGAIAGSCQGIGAFPNDALDVVKTVNSLELEPLCEQLLLLRTEFGRGYAARDALK